MSLSIYTSLYNIERMKFSWRQSLSNWLAFLHGRGEICIALNTSDDDSGSALRAWIAKRKEQNPQSATRIEVVDTSIPYSDPTFDGQIKAAALARCTEPFAMLLDCDETLIPRQYRLWTAMAQELERGPYDAFLVPVVDLIGDEKHYRSIGSKFYIHKNRPNLTRGVVRQARRSDGSINTDLSDSTELIAKETGELARAAAIVAPNMPHYITLGALESGDVPFVTHLGWLDTEQRLRQSAFWKDVWTARRGGENPEPELTLEKLEAIPRYRHNLPSWKDHS